MPTIAIIDAIDQAEILELVLTAAGHTINVFGDGIEFLRSFHAGAADLIILEIGLPVLDGYEVLNRIRLVDKQVPIVAVTAHALSHDREKGLQHGFGFYITKPILDFDAFVYHISRCLGVCGEKVVLQATYRRALGIYSQTVRALAGAVDAVTLKEYELLRSKAERANHVCQDARARLQEHTRTHEC